MYTSIPIKDTIQIIQNQLSHLNEDDEETKQLVLLLESTLKQNYFSYDNKYYIQKDGLPMGSPISSVLSEIYLQD